MIVWIVPRRLRSLNEFPTWRARHTHSKEWETALRRCRVLSDDGTFLSGHVRKVSLTVVRRAPQRIDYANMAGGGVKAIEDALVRLGYAYDDGPDDIVWPPTLLQEVGPVLTTITLSFYVKSA